MRNLSIPEYQDHHAYKVLERDILDYRRRPVLIKIECQTCFATHTITELHLKKGFRCRYSLTNLTEEI